MQWIMFLTLVFNFIFSTSSIPLAWGVSRLIVIFKKGSRLVCDNYRGIAISDTFGKIFDTLLCLRLQLWFKPCREQAGAQRGRGCAEHLLTLRLLIDYAISKKCSLFLVFVDFSKAYDKVPRNALIRLLCQLGCGYLMISAIANLYSNTQMVLGAALISTTIGVRQGSPSSCFLFTMYIDSLVRDLRAVCGVDGFLGRLHCLLLMDDTILLATSRDQCIKKVEVLRNFCNQSGMVINQSKM